MASLYKEIQTKRIGIPHVVMCDVDCSIYSPSGIVVASVSANEQKTFIPLWSSVLCDCDSVIVRPVFKANPLSSSTAATTEVVTTRVERSMPYCVGVLPDALASGAVYDLGVLDDVLDLSELALESLSSGVSAAELWFRTGAFVPSVIWPASAVWAEGSAPVLSALSAYRFALRLEGGCLHICLSPYYPKAVWPAGCRLAYIESDGSQYIDTGVALSESLRCLRVEWSPLAVPASGNACVLGALDSLASGALASLFLNITYGWVFSFNVFSSYLDFASTGASANVVLNGRHSFCTDGCRYLIDGMESSSLLSPVGAAGQSLYLCALNAVGSPQDFAQMRLFGFEYKDDVAHVHLLPYQLCTGAVGLLDVLSGSFYANAGEGVFVAGPVI